MGFYIHKNVIPLVSEIKGVSERIATFKLKLDTGGKDMITLIQVYAPTLQSDNKATEEFYKLLENTYNTKKLYYSNYGRF